LSIGGEKNNKDERNVYFISFKNETYTEIFIKLSYQIFILEKEKKKIN
jgi:hypothetical protein